MGVRGGKAHYWKRKATLLGCPLSNLEEDGSGHQIWVLATFVRSTGV